MTGEKASITGLDYITDVITGPEMAEQEERENQEKEALRKAAAAPDRDKLLEAVAYLENLTMESVGANTAIGEACFTLEAMAKELE